MYQVITLIQFQVAMNRKREFKELRERDWNYLGNHFQVLYLSNKQLFIYIYSCQVPQVPKNKSFIELNNIEFKKKCEKTKPQKREGTLRTKMFINVQQSYYDFFMNYKVVPKTRELNHKFQGTTFIFGVT